jgi:hypothetical protein
MAGACFGNVKLEGVSLPFRDEVYRLVKELAIEKGFGRQVRIGGEPCQGEPEDSSDSGSESEGGRASESSDKEGEPDAPMDEGMPGWRRDITE